MFNHKNFDLLSSAIIALNDECQIVYLNKAAQKLLGFNSQQLNDQSLFDLVDLSIEQSFFLQLSQQQQAQFIDSVHIETHRGLITANLLVSSFTSDHKNNSILVEIQSDPKNSHRRKDLELQQQSRISNHLIRNLAHEIKNPLGGIKGAAQLLQRKLTQQQSQALNNSNQVSSFEDLANSRFFSIIIQESDRLSELVNRLLLPAKPEQKSLVNIHLLIEKALEVVLLQCQSTPKIIKDYDPSLPDFFLCPEQIQQTLLNLLKNATEAIDNNGVIELKTRILLQHNIGNQQHKKVLKIEVIDNGCGIDDKIIDEIFFPTISGKNSSGLGLSIAQSIAQSHQGIIEVESSKRKTTFSFLLPLVEPKINAN